jgi:superfamily I DNA/RNA helicase
MAPPSSGLDPGAPALLPLDTLTAAQQHILAAPPEGEIVVGGLPGSGKTLAAVHRALQLAAAPARGRAGPAVLFLCFNKALAARVRGLLQQSEGAASRRIAVRTVHQWCYRAVRRRLPSALVVDDWRRGELLLAAVEEVRRAGAGLPERELRFWSETVRRAKGVGIADAATALAQPQTGVAGEVEPPALQVVQAYDRRLRAEGLIDYDDYAIIALADPRERDCVDHVVVDEAQDLSALQLDLCRAAARRSLLIVADQDQAIYQVTRLERSLPPPAAYDIYLPASHRTSAEIFALAGRLAPHTAAEAPARHGPPPLYRRFAWSDEEAAFIAATAAELIAAGEPPESIAVIARLRELLPCLADALAQAGVPLARGDRPGVALATIHDAKGREFQTVFVAGLVEGVLPRVMPEMDRAAVGEELALARRQLYVAMTRARERLVLSASEGPPSRLLVELGLDDGEPAP